MADITQKLGFDASSAIASLRNLSDGLNQANANMRNLANTSREFVSKTQGMTAALASMGRNAQSISKMLTQLGYNAKITGTSLAAVGNAGKSGFAAAMQRFDLLAAKAKATASATAAAAAQTQKSSSIGSSALSALSAGVGAIAGIGVFNLISQGMQTFTRYAWPAIEAARTFGLAMAEVSTIAQDTGLSSDQLTRAVLDLSTELGKGAEDVAKGLYEVLSNQVVDATQAVNFLAEAQRLAITTGAETAEAVNALSSVMNSYSLKANDAAKVSDILFETVFIGRVRLDEIADRIGRITPMAAQMGVTFEEVGASIAVMTVQGIKADTAITQLRAIMSKLQKPTEALKKIFKSWGVEDGEAAIRAFGGIEGVLRKLSQETGGSTAAMSEFFNVVRAMTGVMGLGTDEGQRFRDAIRDLEESTGKASEAYRIFIASPSQRLTVEINAAKNAMIEFGAVIGPIVSAFLSGFNTIFAQIGRVFEAFMASDVSSFVDSVSRRIEQKRAESVKNMEKEESEVESKKWRKQEQMFREHVARMVAAQNSSIGVLESKQEAVNEMFKAASSTLLGEFKKSYKGLVDYVQDSTDNIKNNLKTIKGLMDSAKDIRLGVALDKATSPLQRLGLLQGDLNTKLAEARKLAKEAGTDPARIAESAAAYDRAGQAALALSREQEAQGKTQQSYASRLLVAQFEEEQAANLKQVNETQSKNLVGAKAELAAYEGQDAALQEVMKTYVGLLEQRSKFVGTEEQQKQLEQEIEGTFKELVNMVRNSGLDAAFLDALGIDNTVAEFQSKFASSLANATIDWTVQTSSLRQAIDDLNLKILFDAGFTKEALEFLKNAGQGRLIGEGAGPYVDRITQAGTKSSTESANDVDALREARINYNAALGDSALRLAGIRVENNKLSQDMKQLESTTTKIFGAEFRNPFTVIDLWWKGSKTTQSEQLKQGQAAMKIEKELAELRVAAQQEGGFTEGDTAKRNALSTYILEAGEAGILTADLQVAFRNLMEQIDKMASNKKLLGDTAENLRENLETLDAVKPAMDLIRKQVIPEPSEEVKKAPVKYKEEWGETLKNTNLGADQAAASMDKIGTAADGVTTEIGETKSAQGLFAAMVDAAIGGINREISAQNRLTDAVLATNSAKAAAPAQSAEATAYSGGLINYLAAGGRGQDNIHTVLARGEYVSSARTAGKFFSELNAMNNGSRPVHRAQGGSVTNVGDVNVTVKGGDSSQQTVREIGHALRREIQRGNIKLK